MLLIKVNTAQPIADQKIKGCRIEICEPIPDTPPGDRLLERAAEEYDRQAQFIFEGLRDSLPAGTIDRLIGKLLIYKASHFKVNYER